MKARHEAPEWYRVYHREMWDEPDAQEERMVAGPSMSPWPDDLHEFHCYRRWQEARHAYRQANPEFATQEFWDLLAAIKRRAGD